MKHLKDIISEKLIINHHFNINEKLIINKNIKVNDTIKRFSLSKGDKEKYINYRKYYNLNTPWAN